MMMMIVVMVTVMVMMGRTCNKKPIGESGNGGFAGYV